jgi:hypothetical protein
LWALADRLLNMHADRDREAPGVVESAQAAFGSREMIADVVTPPLTG